MPAEIILITVEVVEIINIIKRICAASVTSAVLFSSFWTGAFANYIKWVDFTPTAAAIAEAAEADISSHDGEAPVSMCALLALYASRKGGDFSHYKRGDISSLRKNVPVLIRERLPKTANFTNTTNRAISLLSAALSEIVPYIRRTPTEHTQPSTGTDTRSTHRSPTDITTRITMISERHAHSGTSASISGTTSWAASGHR